MDLMLMVAWGHACVKLFFLLLNFGLWIEIDLLRFGFLT